MSRAKIERTGPARVRRTLPEGHPLHTEQGSDPEVHDFFVSSPKGAVHREYPGKPGTLGSLVCYHLWNRGYVMTASPDTLLDVVRREHCRDLRWAGREAERDGRGGTSRVRKGWPVSNGWL